jgi:hypothetical protein
MSFMEKIFGGIKPQSGPLPQGQPSVQQPAPTNNLQTPPHTSTQQTQQTAPNGVVPEGQQTQEPPKKEESPVEKFKDLWEPPKTDPSNPTPNSQTGFDPAKMMEAAAKVDFAKVVSQEDLQKIAAGGQEAVAAFANALNKTAQTVFGQATIVAQKLSDQSAQKTRDELMAQIPNLVKKQSLNEGLFSENAVFSNPAVQPVVQALTEQLSQKYPKATSAELQGMAKDYLTGVAGMIVPQKTTNGPSEKGKSKEVDWTDYLA